MGKGVLVVLTVFIAVCLWPVRVQAAQGKGKYRQGYYMDYVNNRVDGFIYFNGKNYDHFYYRKTKRGRKERIDVSKAIAFGYDNRNFEMLQDLHLQFSIWNTHARRAFAELLVNGRVKLYCVYTEVNQPRPIPRNASAVSIITNYLLKRDDDYTYLALSPKEKQFKQQMSEYLKDNPALSQKILMTDSSSFNLPGIITSYNKGL